MGCGASASVQPLDGVYGFSDVRFVNPSKPNDKTDQQSSQKGGETLPPLLAALQQPVVQEQSLATDAEPSFLQDQSPSDREAEEASLSLPTATKLLVVQEQSSTTSTELALPQDQQPSGQEAQSSAGPFSATIQLPVVQEQSSAKYAELVGREAKQPSYPPSAATQLPLVQVQSLAKDVVPAQMPETVTPPKALIVCGKLETLQQFADDDLESFHSAECIPSATRHPRPPHHLFDQMKQKYFRAELCQILRAKGMLKDYVMARR
eukprot:TRINITY_DN93191_c0_g1_i1.p1 TRINITY_DN93191_c0_g1~~TRINITY_DN93191_c0_g1_i1.p1  ORF type:complete len:264 (+),score=56.40 TRINITY_DN93191_c0_g1_i1:60-851(+)